MRVADTSSYTVFMHFVSFEVSEDKKTEIVCVDRVLSEECYKHWLVTRKERPKNPQESFRKALTSHCRGIDGRKPFPVEVERALLHELRKKRVWPCFENSDCNIGKRGLQLQGYWETIKYSGAPPVTKGTSRKRKRRPTSFSDSQLFDFESLQLKIPRVDNDFAFSLPDFSLYQDFDLDGIDYLSVFMDSF